MGYGHRADGDTPQDGLCESECGVLDRVWERRCNERGHDDGLMIPYRKDMCLILVCEGCGCSLCCVKM